MQLAIKERYRHNSSIFVFNTASDCSFFLGEEKSDFVSKNARYYYKENGTLEGLDLVTVEGKIYGIVAYVSPLISYHPNFNFWSSDCRTYGNCVIIKNTLTNKTYGFKDNSSCCAFLGRSATYLDNYKSTNTTKIKSYKTNDVYQILQFKLKGKHSTVAQTRKECERFSSSLRMHKKDNRKEVARLLHIIDDKYDNLIDAWKDNCPEFFELQRLETSYEFNFFEW